MRISRIKSTIEEIPFVSKLNKIEENEGLITGNIEILFEGLLMPLVFDFIIKHEYPLKTYEHESIQFINSNLIGYKHIMGDGHICIHTSHSTRLEEKLKIDFRALKDWIVRYYINKEEDSHYEHILVKSEAIDNTKYAFMFTDPNSSFLKDEFGSVSLSILNVGVISEIFFMNYYVKYFYSLEDNELKECKWSKKYMSAPKHLDAIYYFLEEAPTIHNRFAISNWSDFKFNSTFINYLYTIQNTILNDSSRNKVMPLFIGYNISKDKIHWQVALLKIGNFPIKGAPIIINGKKTKEWETILEKTMITWGNTYNCSYEYFFGRGRFCDALTKKKILIIGIGAIGSMVAKTLTQCGCTHIHFTDYDIKEPENVCRSEYKFTNGVTSKSKELQRLLLEISPFVNTQENYPHYFEEVIKTFFNNKTAQLKLKQELENYDLIIDCSTDNDLMYVLNTMHLDIDLINISMTNHANELICAFYPNIYKFVNNQFSNILDNDVKDLYNPTGCWSPTFKASYNDIAVLVQLALKHLNRIFNGDKPKHNFVIQEVDNSYKIIEY